MRIRSLATLLPGLTLVAAFVRGGEPPGHAVLFPFVEKYCLKCHDTGNQKGDREFETFTLPLTSEASLITAKDIIDQLTLGEMPPHKAQVLVVDPVDA